MPRRSLAVLLPLVVAAMVLAGTALGDHGDTTPPVVTVAVSPGPNASGWNNTDVTVDWTVDDQSTWTEAGCLDQTLTDQTTGTTLTCEATNQDGLSSGTQSVTVKIDKTPPTVTGSDPAPVEATGPTTPVSVGSATDNFDPSPALSCGPPSPYPVGPTPVSCTATDDAGNTSASTPFNVTVTDNTPPTVTVPSGFPVEAPGPSGATVNYAASASDLVDGAITPTCSPASGTKLSIGAHEITCTAKDTSNNESESKSFTVTVTDTVSNDPNAPVFGALPAPVVEANGPSGSVVDYGPVSASDPPDEPINATCSPPAGATFALDATTVNCTATDSDGNTGSASFTVTVQDTTPPVLTVPGQLIIGSEGGVSTSSPVIAAWLSFVTAADLVDPSPILTKPAPATFPVGLTAVTFTATDASGNTTEKTTGISVVSPGTPGSVTPSSTVIPLSVQPDPAPDNVRNVKATPGNRRILLSWSLPAEADFDGVLVTRRPGKGRSEESVVYKGKQTSVVDTSVVNGVSYRYLIVAYDKGGNRSVGVGIVAVAKLQLLLAPGDGARVTGPPLLKWKKVRNAAYYNVQLYRNQRKVNSRWPAGTSLRLTASWAYDGHRFRLGRGCYDWWVWPGFGKKAGARYGEALGHSTFCVKSKPKAA